MPQQGHPDWSQHHDVYTNYVKLLSCLSAFLHKAYFEDAIENPSKDENLDYNSDDLEEEEASVRAMAISEDEERTKWEGLEEAIRCSQQVAALAPPPAE
jgi:hypothetical protein